MIYDAFPFFNELDLLELRLKTLESVVDRFILVEATRTHTGHPKPLFFQENKSRFSAFLNRIEHIVVDDYPPFETAWTYENHQRNCIVRGLSNAKPDDWILVSDLDEIPNPSMIEKCVQRPGRYRRDSKSGGRRHGDRPIWNRGGGFPGRPARKTGPLGKPPPFPHAV